MKCIFKNPIFTFVLGIICCFSITVFALSVHSNQVVYTPSNANFKVENVEEALDELYAKMRNVTIGSMFSNGVNSGSSLTNSSFVANQDYVCIFTMRGVPTFRSATNADVMKSQQLKYYLDEQYCAYFLYLKALSSTITFNFDGARGLGVACFPILRD